MYEYRAKKYVGDILQTIMTQILADMGREWPSGRGSTAHPQHTCTITEERKPWILALCTVWYDHVLVHCHMITPFTKLFAPLKWVLPKHSYFIFIVEGSQSLTESGFASRPRHTVQRELFASCVELDLNMTQIPLTQYICRGPRKTSLTTCQPKSPLKLISPTCTVHQGRAK